MTSPDTMAALYGEADARHGFAPFPRPSDFAAAYWAAYWVQSRTIMKQSAPDWFDNPRRIW